MINPDVMNIIIRQNTNSKLAKAKIQDGEGEEETQEEAEEENKRINEKSNFHIHSNNSSCSPEITDSKN